MDQDETTEARLQALESLVRKALGGASGLRVQGGLGVLDGSGTAGGGSALVAATITGISRIFVQMADPGAGALPGFASFDVPVGLRLPGSFNVNAIDTAKLVIPTAVCTFNWLVVDV